MTIYVEDASNAVALVQALKAETRLPIVPVAAKGSKESRVEGVTGTLEAGKVYLPKEAPWLLDFEPELLSFPLGKHDDQVDAFVLALSQVAAKSNNGFFVFTFRSDGLEEYIWYDGDERHREILGRPDIHLAERGPL